MSPQLDALLRSRKRKHCWQTAETSSQTPRTLESRTRKCSIRSKVASFATLTTRMRFGSSPMSPSLFLLDVATTILLSDTRYTTPDVASTTGFVLPLPFDRSSSWSSSCTMSPGRLE